MIKSKYLFVIAQFIAMFWLCSAQAAIITQTQDFRLFSSLFLGAGADTDSTEDNLQSFYGFNPSLGALNSVEYRYDANVNIYWSYTGDCITGLFGREVCAPAIPSLLTTVLTASYLDLTGNGGRTRIEMSLPPIRSEHPGSRNFNVNESRLFDEYTTSSLSEYFSSSSSPVLSFATYPFSPINFFNAAGYTEIIGSLSLEFDYTPAVSSGGESPVSVPEPSTLGLLALGLMGLATRRRNF